jgi:cell division protein FtsB
MEKKINKYKIRELDYKEEIEKKTKEIEKYTSIQNELKKEIEKLDNKISLSEKLMKNEKDK